MNLTHSKYGLHEEKPTATVIVKKQRLFECTRKGEGILSETLVTTYAGVFFLVFALNTVPVLMPPTWVVLSTLYLLFPQQLALIPLVIIGAFASTLGRAVLSRIGVAGRRLMCDERKRSLDAAGQALRSRRHGGFVLTLFYALSPLPSNAYFLTMGTMKCRYFSIFLGFWLGRLISYGLTTMAAHTVLTSLAAVFTSHILAVAALDSLGIASMIVFMFIDWEKLLREKRLVFIKPRLSLK